MGRSNRVVITDDLTGEEIPEAEAQAVRFTYGGAEYELDLSADSAAKLDKAIQPFVSSARRVGGSTRGKAKATPTHNLAEVRAWAADNGHKVSDRGRVPASVLEAFDAAHGK